MEVGEGQDEFADADDEERGEGGGQEEAIQGAHQLPPDLQAQRRPPQVGEGVVVAGAEQQHLGPGAGAVLKARTS